VTDPVRIDMWQRRVRRRRPLTLRLGVRFPELTLRISRRAFALPPGRRRRRFLEWGFRALLGSALNLRDYDAVRIFAKDDLEFIPAPQLAAMVTEGAAEPGDVMTGVDAVINAMEIWLEAWGESIFRPVTLYDVGDGRILVLYRMHTKGRTSGVALADLEYAELFEWRDGRAVRFQQWLHWHDARIAAGVAQADRISST
jgi:hypothetical protein